MAHKLPKPLNRREILYNPNADAAQLSKEGDNYFDKGLIFDAAAFYVQAKDKSGLERIHKTALKLGDAFLMSAVQDVFPELVSESDWKQIEEQAKSLGKDFYAERATKHGAPIPPPMDEHSLVLKATEEEAAVEEVTTKRARRRKRRG